MVNKYLSSVMIVTSAFTLVIGQTPEPNVDRVSPQAFSFFVDGSGGYLGVQTVEVTKENFSRFGLRGVRGVAVEKVLENSPAASAGLKDGDVILRFNGEEISSTRKLTRLIGEVEPDHQVRLVISRGGAEQEITATLGKRQTPTFAEGGFKFEMPPMGSFPAPEFFEKFKDMPRFEREMPNLMERFKDLPQLKDFKFDTPGVWTSPDGNSQVFTWRSGEGRIIGVSVSPLTKQLAQHFGVEDGLLISEVRENSAAARSGLKAGDVIVEANGKAVKGDLDLIREVNGKKEGDVQLTIVRDGKRQTISVTPEVSKDGGFFFNHGDGDGKILTPPATPRAPVAPMPALRWNRVI